jgi:hypothetical protein
MQKSNDVLAEQIKNIVEAIGRIEAILMDMQKNYTSREEVKSMITIHAREDDVRFGEIFSDLKILRNIIYGTISAVVAIGISIFVYI